MRHFIAIVTPDNINLQVLEWKNYMLQRFQCKVALRSPAHITLVPPFYMSEAEQTDMKELLHSFAMSQTTFSIHLKNFAAFKPRVIYVHVEPDEQLNAVKNQLETTLLQSKRFSIKKEDRPFHPHVTIANRDLEKEDFPLAWQHFQHLAYDAIFTADAIALLRHNGRVWEIAATFPLGNKR